MAIPAHDVFWNLGFESFYSTTLSAGLAPAKITEGAIFIDVSCSIDRHLRPLLIQMWTEKALFIEKKAQQRVVGTVLLKLDHNQLQAVRKITDHQSLSLSSFSFSLSLTMESEDVNYGRGNMPLTVVVVCRSSEVGPSFTCKMIYHDIVWLCKLFWQDFHFDLQRTIRDIPVACSIMRF